MEGLNSENHVVYGCDYVREPAANGLYQMDKMQLEFLTGDFEKAMRRMR